MDQIAAIWRRKDGRGEPKVTEKSAFEGLVDRLVGILGASGGTRRVLLLKGASETDGNQRESRQAGREKYQSDKAWD